MFRFLMWAAVAVMAIVAVQDAYAAEIKIRSYSNGNQFVSFEGAVEKGDAFALERAIARVEKEYVDIQLDSPGGDAEEMKKLSKMIRSNPNIIMVVSSGRSCYSACAVMWASAEIKWASEDAEIGFHVSSIAILPEAVEWLNEYHSGFGWQGIQQFIQDNYAEDLRYYFDMPVAYPHAFVAEIAMASGGNNFWMLDKANAGIIGEVQWF